jgi:hypothetical protein
MKLVFTERNIAAVLFVLVLITFSLAQKDTQKLDQFYNGVIHNSLQTSMRSVLNSQLNREATPELPASEITPVN